MSKASKEAYRAQQAQAQPKTEGAEERLRRLQAAAEQLPPPVDDGGQILTHSVRSLMSENAAIAVVAKAFEAPPTAMGQLLESDEPDPEPLFAGAPVASELAAASVAALRAKTRQAYGRGPTQGEVEDALRNTKPAAPVAPPKPVSLVGRDTYTCLHCRNMQGLPAYCASCARQLRYNANPRVQNALQFRPPGVPREVWHEAIGVLLNKRRPGCTPQALLALIDAQLPLVREIVANVCESINVLASEEMAAIAMRDAGRAVTDETEAVA